ncbi:chaperone DNAJ [Coprinopsis cinerea okayama7|uniref:Chaperone DNAJ n=1 Tax=Coprinopsis cinerea (strain Okayama-7 / 130 / ATCC MYA-4618 / FGSC 9003) TaxID=240176 RepID=A8N4Y4_COPC7|nr:chaperone DNAJ [Coprinopsis cinerea okayama7\|eukprot:XP_001829995.1 chaperone DNAJ [Coprinopsis cinerea okayama7\
MNSLLSLGGWSIIPDLATRYTLSFIYQTPLLHRLLRLKPSNPGTPRYRKHYGTTFALVVLGYLLYTLIQQAKSMPPNFYQILNVPNTVDDAGLKVAFRQFAKRNHPDRPGVGVKGEALFIFVRDVYEALKDPAVRFAYDRFGPEVLGWRATCSTHREFLRQGLLASSGYHIVAFLVLLFWSAVGQPSPISFWRYILFAALLAAELLLILSPTPTSTLSRHTTILHLIFPHRVAYQHILFLHQFFMFMSVALTRVAPHLIPYDEYADPRVEQALLERTVQLVAVADREASKLLHTELQSIASPSPPSLASTATPRHPSFARMEPISPNTASSLMQTLQPEMEQLVIEANLKRQEGPLKSAWDAAVARAFKTFGRRAGRSREATESTGEPEQERIVENDDVDEDEEEDDSRQRTPRASRETTPTAPSPRPHHLTPNLHRYHTPDPPSSPNGRLSVPSNSASASPRPPHSPIKIKQEDEDETHILGNSSYFMVSGSPRSQHYHSTDGYRESAPPGTSPVPSSITHAQTKPTAPRTPGDLPSPRPSPSPPPQGRSPTVKPYQPAFAFGSPPTNGGGARHTSGSPAARHTPPNTNGRMQPVYTSPSPPAHVYNQLGHPGGGAGAYRSFAFPSARGYFAKGTANEEVFVDGEEGEEELRRREYIRARSLSC